MISIIICSRNADISQSLRKNISETIGTKYELIVIDNSKNNYSIFSAYNAGVHRSKYSYLCFMHEDILYHTNDWGQKVLKHFNDAKIGMIGIAGGHYIPHTPASWPNSHVSTINIIQRFEDPKRSSKHIQELGYCIDNKAEVVAVDGVWFCIPKCLFNVISFDEHQFSGFHFYDMDICMQVKMANYKIIVISDILLEHFSEGKWNKEWFECALIFYNKWQNLLPQQAGVTLSSETTQIIELFTQEIFSLGQELSRVKSEIIRIQQSKKYRLGKLVLRPMSIIKQLFNFF